MSDRTITEDNLGAWLIKCDPESKFDLPRAIEQGWTYIDNWSVSRGYRSSMMRPEHKVILWVSGNGRRMARGIWGLGWVEGFVHDTIPEELEEDEVRSRRNVAELVDAVGIRRRGQGILRLR